MRTISEIRNNLLSKSVSAVELTQQFLDKINADAGGTYITVTAETALAAAEAVNGIIAENAELPPLAGIPFTLKDNFSTENIKTTCGSKMLADYIPVFDATIWEIIKNGGGILLGKTNMDEFAMGSGGDTSFFGEVKNPVYPGYSCGGSSSGTAAAVAAGLAVYGIGTDSGGSVRLPATFCGLPSLKPTYGALSRSGIISATSSPDSAGIIAADLGDIKTVFDVLSVFDRRDATSIIDRPEQSRKEINKLKIAILSDALELSVPEIRSVTEAAAKSLEERGAFIDFVSIPNLPSAFSANYIISCAETSSNTGRYEGVVFGYAPSEYTDADDFVMRSRGEAFGDEVKRRIILGTRILSGDQAIYKKAMGVREYYIALFNDIFETYDAVLTPVTPVITPKSGAETPFEIDIFLSLANLCGLPAVTVPCGDINGAPAGIQLIGPRFTEHNLLSVGGAGAATGAATAQS